MGLKEKLNIQTIDIDISKELIRNRDKLKSLDVKSRFKRFRFFDDNLLMPLSNITVNAYMIKADGKEIYNALTVDTKNNYAELEFTTQALVVPGELKMELVLAENGAEISSFILVFNVIESLRTNNSIESSNEYTALYATLEAVKKVLSDFNNLYNLNDTRLKELYNTHNTTLTKLKTDKTTEIDALIKTKGDTLDSLKNSHDSKLNGLYNTHNTTLTKLETDKTAEINSLITTKGNALDSLKNTHDAALTKLKTDKTTEIDALIKTKGDALDSLKNSHDSKLSGLYNTHNTTLTKLETDKTAEFNSLITTKGNALDSLKNTHDAALTKLKTDKTAEIDTFIKNKGTEIDTFKNGYDSKLTGLYNTHNTALTKLKTDKNSELVTFESNWDTKFQNKYNGLEGQYGQDIAKIKQDVTTNATNIQTNKSNISKNATDIKTNKSNIEAINNDIKTVKGSENISLKESLDKHYLSLDRGILTDFNNGIQEGKYYLHSSSLIPNSPPTKQTALYGVVQVLYKNYNELFQFVTLHNLESWLRFRNGKGEWGAWNKIPSVRDFENRYGNSGFQKFPDGLIFQWGSMKIEIGGGTQTAKQDIVYPIAFKNPAFYVNGNIDNVDGNGEGITDDFTLHIFNYDRVAGATVRIKNILNPFGSFATIQWFAIGV